MRTDVLLTSREGNVAFVLMFSIGAVWKLLWVKWSLGSLHWFMLSVCTVKWAEQQPTQHGASYCTGSPCVCLWLAVSMWNVCVWCRSTVLWWAVPSAAFLSSFQTGKQYTSIVTCMNTDWNMASWVGLAPAVSVGKRRVDFCNPKATFGKTCHLTSLSWTELAFCVEDLWS